VVAQARNRPGDPDEWRQIPVVCRWILTLQLALLPALAVFGAEILGSLGPGFEAGALVLVFLVIGELADGTSALYELPAIFYRPRVSPIIVGSTLLLEAGAVAILASQFGAPGAAAGFLLAMLGLGTGRAYFAKSAFGIALGAGGWRNPLLSALAIGIVLTAARVFVAPIPAVVLCMALGSVVAYFGILRGLGISEEDRGLLAGLRGE
jgi:hypothetical protein